MEASVYSAEVVPCRSTVALALTPPFVHAELPRPCCLAHSGFLSLPSFLLLGLGLRLLSLSFAGAMVKGNFPASARLVRPRQLRVARCCMHTRSPRAQPVQKRLRLP